MIEQIDNSGSSSRMTATSLSPFSSPRTGIVAYSNAVSRWTNEGPLQNTPLSISFMVYSNVLLFNLNTFCVHCTTLYNHKCLYKTSLNIKTKFESVFS